MALAGFVAFLGVVGGTGFYSYNRWGTINPVTINAIKGIDDPSECTGCKGGGNAVWRNGGCVAVGICGSEGGKKDTPPPPGATNPAYDTQTECNNSGKGYVWCSSVDSNGKSYAFCNTSGKGCNQAAIDKGYTIQIGIVKCRCLSKDPKTGQCTGGYGIDETGTTYANSSQAVKNEVDAQCKAQKMGTGAYICREGVKGYSGNAACTNLNGVPFTGNLGCFCGTVQVDTGTGHTSYSSTCGCNEETPPPSAPPSPSPSPSAPVMACIGITRNPATGAIGIGDTVTVTCNGSVTPPTAGTLSYKFRYSINNGAFTTLTNKTATTAELTVAACGSYKVQCQACATLNGVLTCDPVWTGATQ
jgi:hypothetical protein